ncbi:uncharacterized protein LOC124280823 [Haliotis rubra]|uniref:uncharacterized protein LOC124280823 n=1 Tax=Haliotis rubra TaxID=36100 RepID=UPI001EE52721|nr:uncharacterized protein LOC124280823 [Haliotis rubra]
METKELAPHPPTSATRDGRGGLQVHANPPCKDGGLPCAADADLAKAPSPQLPGCSSRSTPCMLSIKATCSSSCTVCCRINLRIHTVSPGTLVSDGPSAELFPRSKDNNIIGVLDYTDHVPDLIHPQ